MVGSKTGLVGHVKQPGVKCISSLYYSSGALCGTIIKTNQIMKMVVNIINLIREGNTAQRHKAFIKFLE
jgi:hypothetical protein